MPEIIGPIKKLSNLTPAERQELEDIFGGKINEETNIINIYYGDRKNHLRILSDRIRHAMTRVQRIFSPLDKPPK